MELKLNNLLNYNPWLTWWQKVSIYTMFSIITSILLTLSSRTITWFIIVFYEAL
jgi:hypothetical protein